MGSIQYKQGDYVCGNKLLQSFILYSLGKLVCEQHNSYKKWHSGGKQISLQQKFANNQCLYKYSEFELILFSQHQEFQSHKENCATSI